MSKFEEPKNPYRTDTPNQWMNKMLNNKDRTSDNKASKGEIYIDSWDGDVIPPPANSAKKGLCVLQSLNHNQRYEMEVDRSRSEYLDGVSMAPDLEFAQPPRNSCSGDTSVTLVYKPPQEKEGAHSFSKAEANKSITKPEDLQKVAPNIVSTSNVSHGNMATSTQQTMKQVDAKGAIMSQAVDGLIGGHAETNIYDDIQIQERLSVDTTSTPLQKPLKVTETPSCSPGFTKGALLYAAHDSTPITVNPLKLNAPLRRTGPAPAYSSVTPQPVPVVSCSLPQATIYIPPVKSIPLGNHPAYTPVATLPHAPAYLPPTVIPLSALMNVPPAASAPQATPTWQIDQQPAALNIPSKVSAPSIFVAPSSSSLLYLHTDMLAPVYSPVYQSTLASSGHASDSARHASNAAQISNETIIVPDDEYLVNMLLN